MFKQIKSALFWYYLYRFRKRVAIIITLLALILLSGYIYSDLVEYLKLRNKLELLDFLLPLKWGVILGSIFMIAYLVLSIFQKPAQNSKVTKDENTLKKLSKKELHSLAEQIIQKKRSSKS